MTMNGYVYWGSELKAGTSISEFDHASHLFKPVLGPGSGLAWLGLLVCVCVCVCVYGI